MTPRTIETLFSEALKNQASADNEFDLTLDGPITKQILPRILHAELMVKSGPSFVGDDITLVGYNYVAFDSLTHAKLASPELPHTLAKPWSFGKFLENPHDIIFDFGFWGAAVVSKKDLGSYEVNFRRHILGIWLSYALSPELWGPQGKWIRFHERLEKIFHAANLLDDKSSPGYYKLSPRAALLGQKGFKGTDLGKSYLLVLPWSFSLSALEKLETVIRQEF